ncbi:MAG: preprotein translocase subunit SecE [Candidatus Electrothrix sp. AR3]|nr:preprotein translocase subunit SecE [Candidatus Electrothrix sp. AR3]
MANKKKKSDGKGGAVGKMSEKSKLTPAGVRQFYHEVAAEFKKIVWPDRKVTFGLSGFVILLTILLSAYLGTVDFVLGKLVSLVLQ